MQENYHFFVDIKRSLSLCLLLLINWLFIQLMLVLRVFQKTVSFCSGMKMVYPKDVSLCKQFLGLKNLWACSWKPLPFRHFYYTISSFFCCIFSVFSNDNVHACQNLPFSYQWMTLHLQNSEDLQKIFIRLLNSLHRKTLAVPWNIDIMFHFISSAIFSSFTFHMCLEVQCC